MGLSYRVRNEVRPLRTMKVESMRFQCEDAINNSITTLVQLEQLSVIKYWYYLFCECDMRCHMKTSQILTL